MPSTTFCSASKLFVFSPGGSAMAVDADPAFVEAGDQRRKMRRGNVGVGDDSDALTPGSRFAISSPARATSPAPINMS